MGGGNSKTSCKLPTNVKLTYFNARGRAEVLRYILAVIGVKYEDRRVEKADWPAFKDKTPWGSMPMVELDSGLVLGQTQAIARYFATIGGIGGKTALERAQIDAIAQSVLDILTPMVTPMFEQDEEKKAQLIEEFNSKTLPAVFDPVEKLFAGNSSGYIVGSSLTWGDIALFAISDLVMQNNSDSSSKWPKIAEHSKRIAAIPSIKNHVEKRSDTPF